MSEDTIFVAKCLAEFALEFGLFSLFFSSFANSIDLL